MRYILSGLGSIILILGLALWYTNNKLEGISKTNTDLRVTLQTTEDSLQSSKASEELLNARIAARDIALLAATTEKDELSQETSRLGQIIKNYKPAETTHASECLDMRPPADLLTRLRPQDSGDSKN